MGINDGLEVRTAFVTGARMDISGVVRDVGRVFVGLDLFGHN
jgi:hypothetical protein